MAGNVLQNYINSFENASEKQITDIAIDSIRNFVNGSGMINAEIIYTLMVQSAKIGISSQTSFLNDKEKELAETVFSTLFNLSGNINDLYDILASGITERDFQSVSFAASSPYGIELMKYILAFAYIDGSADDSAINMIENIFGMHLLKEAFSFNSDLNTGKAGSSSASKCGQPITAEEKKVYDCINRLDDGAGLSAETYYDLYGSWNTNGMFDDMEHFDGEAVFSMLEKNEQELGMSRSQFVKCVDSLTKKGYLNKNGQLYTINRKKEPVFSEKAKGNYKYFDDKDAELVRQTLKDSPTPLTIGEIIARTDFEKTITSSWVTALLKSMDDVERTTDGKRGLYSLKKNNGSNDLNTNIHVHDKSCNDELKYITKEICQASIIVAKERIKAFEDKYTDTWLNVIIDNSGLVVPLGEMGEAYKMLIEKTKNWENIKCVYDYPDALVGIDIFGEIHIATTDNYEGWFPIREVDCWSNIAKLVNDSFGVFGLTLSGDVIFARYDFDNFAEYEKDVEEIDFEYIYDYVRKLKNIKEIFYSNNYLICISNDCSCFITNILKGSIGCPFDTQEWRDLVDVKCVSNRFIGMKKDGTVIATPILTGKTDYNKLEEDKWEEISQWKDITSLLHVGNRIVGVDIHGNIYASTTIKGELFEDEVDLWEEISQWNGLVCIETAYLMDENSCYYDVYVGMRYDGQLYCICRKEDNDCSVKNEMLQDFMREVSSWKNVVKLIISDVIDGIIAITKDGKVLAADINRKSHKDFEHIKLFDDIGDYAIVKNNLSGIKKVEIAKQILEKKLDRIIEERDIILPIEKECEETRKTLEAIKNDISSCNLFQAKKKKQLQDTLLLENNKFEELSVKAFEERKKQEAIYNRMIDDIRREIKAKEDYISKLQQDYIAVEEYVDTGLLKNENNLTALAIAYLEEKGYSKQNNNLQIAKNKILEYSEGRDTIVVLKTVYKKKDEM